MEVKFEEMPKVIGELKEMLLKIENKISDMEKKLPEKVDKTLTTKEVAELLGLMPETVRKRFRRGELKGHKEGLKLLFKESEIKKYFSAA